MKTVIYHSADFDGIFCREIAKHFLGPGSEQEPNQFIGWNFGDPPVVIPAGTKTVYVLDLPCDKPFGFTFIGGDDEPLHYIKGPGELVWIDHHKTSIETHPADIPGYRIDGVAACRLAWQWFAFPDEPKMPISYYMPQKQAFLDRRVSEPLAVRLAGEYDVWDKRDERADLFQYGLRAYGSTLTPEYWVALLTPSEINADVDDILDSGAAARHYAQYVDAGNMKSAFLREWEGLKFLCLNGRGNSLTFASQDHVENGHDALLMFYFQGEQWIISLYHASHRRDLDLSEIAKKHGGGGHRGACGFQCDKLPFL